MYTPNDVIERLARGPALLDGLLESVPAQDLKRRPVPGRWSAHENACHVAVMEPMWAERLERILTEDNPRIISYEPADDDPDRLLRMDLRQTMAGFAEITVARLSARSISGSPTAKPMRSICSRPISPTTRNSELGS